MTITVLGGSLWSVWTDIQELTFRRSWLHSYPE